MEHVAQLAQAAEGAFGPERALLHQLPQVSQAMIGGECASLCLLSGLATCHHPSDTSLCCVVTTESCLVPLLQQQDSQLPDWSLLALFLAELRYHLDHNTDSSNSSRWGPYIQLLPKDPVGTVLDWTDGEVSLTALQQQQPQEKL